MIFTMNRNLRLRIPPRRHASARPQQRRRVASKYAPPNAQRRARYARVPGTRGVAIRWRQWRLPRVTMPCCPHWSCCFLYAVQRCLKLHDLLFMNAMARHTVTSPASSPHLVTSPVWMRINKTLSVLFLGPYKKSDHYPGTYLDEQARHLVTHFWTRVLHECIYICTWETYCTHWDLLLFENLLNE